jgi:PAS domain S-box-containing protein
VETRITDQIESMLRRMSGRLDALLADDGATFSDAQRNAIERAFGEGVHEVIGLVKKGKDVHERFVQSVVLNAVDPIIGLDRDSIIFFWNKGAESTFGYAAEDVIGRSLDMLLPDESYREEQERVNRETEERGFVRNLQTQRKTRGGQVLVVSLSQTLIRESDDVPLGMIAILRDQTQMRRFEQQMLHTEKMALAGQLAAGIAHEIGTPLNIISGIAECMLLDRQPGHPEREDLEIVMAQTERIARMIRELLVFSRPQPMRMEPLSPEAELRRAVSLLKGKLEKSGITVEIHADPDLARVSADANQLQQVFLNLLINACDALAMQAGEKRLVVIAMAQRDAETARNEIVVSFEDNGPGLPPEIADRVFEPFVTSKEAGKGTGLGLAVCRRIMDQHGGRIDASTVPGGGTVFHVRFPVDATGRSDG